MYFVEHTFGLRKDTLGDTAFDSSIELRVKVGIGGEIIVGEEILFQSLTRASFALLEFNDCSYISRYQQMIVKSMSRTGVNDGCI